MADLYTESPNSQLPQLHLQNQQVPLTHIQGAVTQKIMHTIQLKTKLVYTKPTNPRK